LPLLKFQPSYKQSATMRWSKHVARMGRKDMQTGFCWGYIRKNLLFRKMHKRENILNWIFKKWDGRAWIWLIWLRIGKSGGLL